LVLLARPGLASACLGLTGGILITRYGRLEIRRRSGRYEGSRAPAGSGQSTAHDHDRGRRCHADHDHRAEHGLARPDGSLIVRNGQATDDQAAGAGADEGLAAGPSAAGRRKKSWRQLLIIVLAAIVLMLLLKAFVVQVYRIPSASMEDTLRTGDRVLVNKLVYHVRGIGHGDIVVFSGEGSWGTTTGAPEPAPPGNPLLRALDDVLADVGVYSTQTYYIKRVIGLPGDRVACCAHGRVTVNGVPLDETPYLFPGARPSDTRFSVVVPPGRLWVMGDNRAISDDSRAHLFANFPRQGTVPESEVAGRAFLVIWPPAQIGGLPIPATFQQAALRAGAAGAPVLWVAGAAADVVAAVPAAGVAAVAFGVPVVVLRLRGRVPRRRFVPRVRARRRGRRRGCAGTRR
jgi:signal peptidase I